MLDGLMTWWRGLRWRTGSKAHEPTGDAPKPREARSGTRKGSPGRRPRTYRPCPRCPDAVGPVRPGRDYVMCYECGTPFPLNATGPDGSQDLVWITKGASVTYHRKKGCYAREAGQKKVENRGGTRAPLTQVTRATAQARGRAPCEICTPPGWRV